MSVLAFSDHFEHINCLELRKWLCRDKRDQIENSLLSTYHCSGDGLSGDERRKVTGHDLVIGVDTTLHGVKYFPLGLEGRNRVVVL